ncbi:unnamed protein product [Brassica oleracea]
MSSSSDPPDLSALPLWVDLMNVPCTGKFVKLHPNTERCVRMDVARVLVEVNLIKPLLQKICFRDRDQPGVTVQVNYPWLPPRCTSCDRWGHFLKDFTKIPSHNILHRGHIMEKQSKMSSSGLQSEVSGKQSDDLASGKQSTDLAFGKQSESLVNCEKSEISVSAGPGMGKEVVLRLLDDLSRVEVISQNQLAANSSNLNEVESGDLTKSLEEGNSIDNGSSLSPGHPKHPRPVGGVESPNGFQALRDIMEEGEIVDYEEEETHQMEEDMNGEVDIIQTNKVSDKRSQKGVAVPSGEHRLSTTQAASQKGRALWREMEAVAASAVGNVYPWIVQGDFNVILPSDEHSRGTHLGTCNSAMRDFQDAIRYCGLTDLAQVGSVFTWTNRQDDVRSFQGS